MIFSGSSQICEGFGSDSRPYECTFVLYEELDLHPIISSSNPSVYLPYVVEKEKTANEELSCCNINQSCCIFCNILTHISIPSRSCNWCIK